MYYIGLMSGTSVDGIDAVLVKDENGILSMCDNYSMNFPDDLKEDIINLLKTFQIHLQKLGEIDHRLGACYAEAVCNLLDKASVNPDEVIAVGCHGQTVFHDPRGKYPFTMQIGDANLIAAKTGITTVNDFRRMDVAFGGDGAPLAPAFHKGYMSSDNERRVILNLGGIANISILDSSIKDVIGFDTGPANCLMDLWIQQCKDKKFDLNGDWAASGSIDERLLDELMKNYYFSLPAPKSTGKELFNLGWLNSILPGFPDIKEENVQATLCDLTAKSISNAVLRYSPDAEAVYSCGGGAYNKFLQERLGHYLPGVKISITDELGVPVQWVESIAFAWLTKQRIEKKPGNLPSVTGACKETLLGAVYQSK